MSEYQPTIYVKIISFEIQDKKWDMAFENRTDDSLCPVQLSALRYKIHWLIPDMFLVNPVSTTVCDIQYVIRAMLYYIGQLSMGYEPTRDAFI